MSLGYVRNARPGEASEIARIQLSTWRTAYRRMLPRRVLDNLDEAWMTRQWEEAITEPPSPRHRVLVAVEQAPGQTTEHTAGQATGQAIEQTAGQAIEQATGQAAGQANESPIVGFVAAGPADDAALAPGESKLGDTTVSITDLLVEPRWGRRGHGSRLLAASVDLWRADGFTTAVAWAYENDPATRSFLVSTGWEPDGATRALDVDDMLVPQLRLHAAIGASVEE